MIWLLLLIIGLPLLEIWMFVEIGQEVGALAVILLTILTAVGGIYVVQLQGLMTLWNARKRIAAGETPGKEVFDGICIALAGVCLLLPGFVTDSFGALLLIPAVRTFILTTLIDLGLSIATASPVSSDMLKQKSPQNNDEEVIDVDFEVVDKKKK